MTEDNYYDFPEEEFEPPEVIDHYTQVVLMAYFVNKLRNQHTLPTTEDAYREALAQCEQNPDVLREIYKECKLCIAAHVHNTTQNDATVMTGIDQTIIDSFEKMMQNQDNTNPPTTT